MRLLSFATVYAAIGVYTWRSTLTKAAVEEVINNRGERAVARLLICCY